MQVPNKQQIESSALRAQSYTTQARDTGREGVLKGRSVRQLRLTFEGAQDAAHSIAYRTLGPQGTANWLTKVKVRLGLWKIIRVSISGKEQEVAVSINSLSKRLGISKELLRITEKDNIGRQEVFKLANQITDFTTRRLKLFISTEDLLSTAYKEGKLSRLSNYAAVARSVNEDQLKNLGIKDIGNQQQRDLSDLRATILNLTNYSDWDRIAFKDDVGLEHILAIRTLGELGPKLVAISPHGQGAFGLVERVHAADGSSYIEKTPLRGNPNAELDLLYEQRNLFHINKEGPQDGLQLKPVSVSTEIGKVGMLAPCYDQGDLTDFTLKVCKSGEASLPADVYQEHCRQLTSGLCDLHNKYEMQHGDLKSLNVLVKTKKTGDAYRVDIADFGGVRTKKNTHQVCTELVKNFYGVLMRDCKDVTDQDKIQQRVQWFADSMASTIIKNNGVSFIGVHPNNLQELSDEIKEVLLDLLHEEEDVSTIVDRHFEKIWEIEQKRDVYALGVIMLSHILGVDEYEANSPECTTVALEDFPPAYNLSNVDFPYLYFDTEKTKQTLLEKGLNEDQANILLKSISGKSVTTPSASELKDAFS